MRSLEPEVGRLLAAQIPRLRRYARALTADPDEADDLVQDCLERGWSRIHLWKSGTDLRAWLFTIMHNLYVNGVKRRAARPESGPVPASHHDPRSMGQEHGLNLRDVERGLAQLSPELRSVLLLVCVEGMSYREVAQVLGVPEGTVMSRLHRARERMRRWFDGDTGPALRRVK